MSTKDQLLDYLKANRGSWVSGEIISNKTAVSRSAIWKHIRQLRKEGYILDSSPKKGYRLLQAPDLLLPGEVRDGLTTRVFGRENIYHFKQIGSTNIEARDYAERGAPEGTLILAENQTEGRGRKGRTWFSPSLGGIYVSLILRPNLSPVESPKITLLTAVALVEALSSVTQLEIRIKWPNDLLIQGKKLAGILTEMSTEVDAVNYIVVGIGINVNTEDFPGSIRKRATSLSIEAGKTFSRVTILREFLRCFETCYELFLDRGFEPVLKRWKELSDIIGKRVKVDMIDRTVIGTVRNIDRDGVLILRDEKGRSQRIFSGDVTLLKA